jgi:DNA-binding XRE family transcriptional regulator
LAGIRRYILMGLMKMKSKKKAIANAVEIMNRRYYKTAERQANLEEARINAEAARLIYQMRTEAQLSQQELAKLVRTTQSVISRLEDDDYDGHSLKMLARISVVLNKHLILTVKPTEGLLAHIWPLRQESIRIVGKGGKNEQTRCTTSGAR